MRRIREIAGMALLIMGALAPCAIAVNPMAYCTNHYRWLTFYHVTNISQTATYWNGPTEQWGWLSAYGGVNDANTMDRWRQITWDQDVSLSGIIIEAFHQRTGGSIGAYEVESSPDGSSGWASVPTANAFSGVTYFDTNFTAAVTARAVRVRFPALSYDMGSGGFGGPGVYHMHLRGSPVAAIDPRDPQFNVLAAGGFDGCNPVITFPERALNEGNGNLLKDQVVRGDSGRTGWYPPPETNETIRVDLGASVGDNGLWTITGARLYAGVYYYYVPTGLNVAVSSDGVTWPTTGFMGMVNGVLTCTNLNVNGRYLKLTQVVPVTWNSSYDLVHELAVGAYAQPIPAGGAVVVW